MKGYCLWLALFLIIPICFEQVEGNRPGGNNCPSGEIPCDDTECIPREDWCDKENDCRDGSDEQYCRFNTWYSYAYNDCTEIHFECKDGPCVPASTKCDGFQDCKDNSDETDCAEMEDKGCNFEECAAPPLKSVSSESSDNDNTYGTDDLTTSPTGSVETSFYPSHVPPIISTPRSSEDDYYKTYRGSTNDATTSFDNNRAQPASPQITYNQLSGHSHSYDSSRVGQYPETSVAYNPNHNSQENIRSGYPSGASIRYPVQEFSTTVGPCGSERNCRLENSSGIFIRLPSRKFPRRFQQSISDTRDSSSQHGSDRYLTSGHSNGASIWPPTHEYLSTVRPPVSEARDEKSQYGGNGNFRFENSSGIFVRLPSRKFPRRFQQSISDTRDSSSQHGSDRYFTTGHSNGASIRPPTHEYISTVQPPVSEAHDEKSQYGGNGNFRLENSSGIFVRLPSRKFPRTRYQGRSQTSPTVSPPKHYTLAQHADYGDSKYGIQSDSGQSENYIYEPFYFKTNYARKFGRSYEDNVERATKWLLNQRNAYGWGGNTSRALIALSLVNNSFPFSSIENELMKKSLATHFGIKMLLLRDKSVNITNGELATYINALLATCQNPKDFFNNDVMQKLRGKTNIFVQDANPFAYLTLCLTNTPVEYNELVELIKMLSKPEQDERTSDIKILATTALACFQRQDQYKSYLESTVKIAYQNLLRSRLTDYSFGSIYTTALAAQALMSIDTDEWHDAKKTVDFLVQSQSSDGSFGNGDMLATYLILPILSGRSLLHLRNTRCDPVKPVPTTSTPICHSVPDGPKTGIYYTITVGYPEVVSTNAIYLEIPKGSNFSYAMDMAECLNSKFRFLYKKLDNGNIDVHTIVDIPNDTELGFRWRLYVINEDQGQEVTFDLRKWYNEEITELIPQDNQEFIYWYLPIFL